MEIFLYSRSGHNFGLENIRRSAVIYKKLIDLDPTFATADYRAATFAKSELGIKKGLGVDILANLPHLMRRKDILIFDTLEASETMREYMADFCEILLEVGVDIPYDIVDDIYFEPHKIENQKGFFFADDDYEGELLGLCHDFEPCKIPLLLGHYFFLGSETKLAPYFGGLIEDTEYESFIRGTQYLLTSSTHAALESLAAGNSPVFFPRHIKEYKGELALMERYNIPQISGDTMGEIIDNFESVIKAYPQTNKIEKIDLSSIVEHITTTKRKFDAIFQ